ncbi:MAG: hypothetical protein AAGE65_07880 [Planctomycetota bacterium]
MRTSNFSDHAASKRPDLILLWGGVGVGLGVGVLLTFIALDVLGAEGLYKHWLLLVAGQVVAGASCVALFPRLVRNRKSLSC